jgi:SAM-dependent methyltransferase
VGPDATDGTGGTGGGGEAPYARAADVYDLIYDGIGKDYEAESRDVAAAVRSRRPDARSLLDVACGTGGHLVHLRAAFDEVEGVELSEAMATRARRRLPDVPIHSGDMRTFDLGRTFDAVVCLFSSIGYTRTPEDLERALGRMVAHLVPGGVLVVDGWYEPDAWRTGYVTADAAHDDDRAVARVSRSLRVGRTSVLDQTWLIATADGVDTVVERHELGLFSASEVEAALAATGCTDVEQQPDAVMGDRTRWIASAPP